MEMKKRIISSLLVMATAFSLSCPSFAADSGTDTADTETEVVQMLIVSDDGCYLYQGADAQAAYNQLEEGTFINDPANLIASVPVPSSSSSEKTSTPNLSDDPNLSGAFSYKYRFVPDSGSGKKVYGDYSIISDPWGNATDTTQSSTVTFTASASGSISAKLTGKYLDALESEIGTQYTETFSSTVSVNYSVPSHKRIWLQYKPEYTRYVGEVQKYFIPRYNRDRIVVESSKDVEVLEAYERSTYILGHRYTLPAGTYTWCQDSDYMSKKPPVIQN